MSLSESRVHDLIELVSREIIKHSDRKTERKIAVTVRKSLNLSVIKAKAKTS